MYTTTEIIVSRTRIYHRGGRVPFTWSYEAFGPDGSRFDNGSIVELRRVLKHHYPDVTIVEPWKTQH